MTQSLASSPRIGLMQASKTGVKSLARRYAIATSSFRCLPDFLIIGAKRAASTSLWNSVVQHPDVMRLFPKRMKIKGTGYFSVNYEHGLPWYRSHFPLRSTRARRSRRRGVPSIVGEATPYYLFHPLAPSRAKSTIPQAKLLVILRNPVDRAYSHYRERVRHGAETLSFEDALDAEPERTAQEEERLSSDPSWRSVSHEDLSYVAQGRYAACLERWFGYFDRSSLLVIVNEDFDRDRDHELQKVWEFLGVTPSRVAGIERFNYHPSEAMRPETRERLLETFEPENRRLERLIGVDLSLWRT